MVEAGTRVAQAIFDGWLPSSFPLVYDIVRPEPYLQESLGGTHGTISSLVMRGALYQAALAYLLDG